jgi:hypothetical protein
MGHHRADGRFPCCDSWQLKLKSQGLEVKLLVLLVELLLVTTVHHIYSRLSYNISKDLRFELDNLKNYSIVILSYKN